MDKAQGSHHALRQATREHHDRVDAIFSQFDLTSRKGYVGFLQAQAAALIPIEAALDRGPGPDVLPDWPSRRRAELIRADLRALDAPEPEPLSEPDLPDSFTALGTIYVLEGSRLGGSLLRRSVSAGLPAQFLSASAPQAWRSLITVLEARLTDVQTRLIAIKAASEAFTLFERSGQRQLETA